MKATTIIILLIFINPIFAQNDSNIYYIEKEDGSLIEIDTSKFLQVVQDIGEEWTEKDGGDRWDVAGSEISKERNCSNYCRTMARKEIKKLNDKLIRKQYYIDALERRIEILEMLNNSESNE